jgi:hypothetical protein
MANTKIQSQTKTQLNADGTVEVLYQKMGDRWFAFSLIDDEVFVGSITQEEIEQADKKSPMYSVSGNS